MPTTPPRRPTSAPPNPVTRPITADAMTATEPKSGVKTLPPDSRVGKYVVRKPLGKGGMGCVYLAWDDDLRRTVAVKVMHPELADESEHRQRFVREARAMAALSHDNVAGVFDVGQSGGLVYYAMPHLSGKTLVQFLNQRGRPSVAAAVRIAREVASGLAAAHAIGLLHRDIKPGNIFLEAPRGRVKLLDFGLATSVNGDGRLTLPGMVVGTPAYMSPEQARGLPLDARADLFSLGAVMYHLTTGRMPFEGVDSFAVLTALTLETPSGVRESNPKVPVRLERLIARLLDKKPDGRPASAAEVVSELKAIEKELTEGTSPAVSVVVTAEAVDADDPDTELLTEEVKEPADLAEPPPTRRRRKRKGRKAKLRLYLEVGLMAGGVAGVLALVLGVTLLLVNLNKTQPPAAPTTTPPPPAAPRPLTHTRPWDVKLPDGRVQWWWYDHSGTPRPLPPFWHPGDHIPHDFQMPHRP